MYTLADIMSSPPDPTRTVTYDTDHRDNQAVHHRGNQAVHHRGNQAMHHLDIYSTARGRNAFFGCRQGLFVTIKELHMIICLLYMYMCQSFMGKT